MEDEGLPSSLWRWGSPGTSRGRTLRVFRETARQTDRVNFEVQQAYEQVLESERTVRLYEKTTPALPLEQRLVERFFKGLDTLTDRRLSQAQRLCRPGETAQLGSLGE